MFPDNPRRQAGFLLPVAVFILVVMSTFAIGLWHTSVQTSTSVAQELLSTQAFYAAESGAQVGAGQLFSGGNKLEQANTACNNMSFTLNYSTAGLNSCSSIVSCSCRVNDPCSDAEPSTYIIESEGQCGSGQVSAQRTVRVDAFLSDEE